MLKLAQDKNMYGSSVAQFPRPDGRLIRSEEKCLGSGLPNTETRAVRENLMRTRTDKQGA